LIVEPAKRNSDSWHATINSKFHHHSSSNYATDIFSVHHVLSSTAILINTLNQEGLISKFYLLQTVSVLAEN
jgi:hypothetical protein